MTQETRKPMEHPSQEKAWFVVHTRSRFENKVHEGLLRKELETFLPKIKTPSRRKDRKKIIQVPIFPGYLFVHTNLSPNERLEILKTAGVVRMVGNRAGPVPVPEETIDSLKIIITSQQPVVTGKKLIKGDRVIVVSGPFTGVAGKFVRYRGKGRVVVDIEALGQYAGVDVHEEDIEHWPEIVS
jgi:transcription elongation factor/antiterminator RfaH